MDFSISYELYKGSGSKRILDSAFDDRHQAIYEAKALAERLKGSGIKLVEEKFDALSGDAHQKVIFTRKSEIEPADPKKLNVAARPKRGRKQVRAKDAQQKKELASNVKIIDQMEGQIKSKIDDKRAKQKAAKDRKVRWMKSLNGI